MRRTALLCLPTLLLLACSAPAEEPAAASSASSSSAAATTTAATTTTASATPTGPITNARGNIVKAIGEEGGTAGSDGARLATFVVESITPDPACTPDFDAVPENGHFVVMSWRVSTTPALGSNDSYFSVSPFDFSYIGSDGLTQNAGTDASFYCLDSNDLLASGDYSPASEYSGSVVLDVAETTGTIIWRPSFVQGGGWEWTF